MTARVAYEVRERRVVRGNRFMVYGAGEFLRSFPTRDEAEDWIEYQRYGAANPQRCGENPATIAPVMIYGRVLTIHAQKTQPHVCDSECKKFGHRYYHDFKDGAAMWGLPNGDILIRSKK